jgi:hypothetical protein
MSNDSIKSDAGQEIPHVATSRGFKSVPADAQSVSTVLSMLILGSSTSAIAEKVADQFEKYADACGLAAEYLLRLPSPATLEIEVDLTPLEGQPNLLERTEDRNVLSFHLDRNGFILS